MMPDSAVAAALSLKVRRVKVTASEESKTTRLISEVRQPITIEVTRGQKGSYGWSVRVQAEDQHQALFLVEAIEAELRKRFGSQLKPEDRLAEYKSAPVKHFNYEEDVV